MKIRACTFLLILSSLGLAHATILPPTGSPPVAPDVFNTAVNGPFLADSGLQNFMATNALGQTTISGTYRATVYSDSDNVFCAGCLDFFVAVTSSAASTDDIERVTLASFSGYLTDVGFSIGAGNIPDSAVPQTVDRSSNGSVIGFNFAIPNGVAPGSSTEVLEVQTNATAFVEGTLQVIDSSVASVAAFEPCPVPEAGSISLTLGGLLMGIGFLRRRRTAP